MESDDVAHVVVGDSSVCALNFCWLAGAFLWVSDRRWREGGEGQKPGAERCIYFGCDKV